MLLHVVVHSIIAFRRIWIRNFQISFSETKTEHFGVAHTLTGINLYQCSRVSSYESKPAEIAWCKLHWHEFIRVSRVILVRVNHLQTRNNAENNFFSNFITSGQQTVTFYPGYTW